jgi:hypothetical protein
MSTSVGIRTVVVVALAGWLGWLLFRGVVRRRVPWIGIALICVPLVLLFWTERQWISAERDFTAVARSIAPGSAGVHCQRMGEAFVYVGGELGHVEWGEDGGPSGPAMITYETCQQLTEYTRESSFDRMSPTLDQVVAVHVLSHEAWHLTGDHSEADTECKAMQSDADVAERLGATPQQARALAETYAAVVYPHMTDTYRDRRCVEGGPLDLTPDDERWP